MNVRLLCLTVLTFSAVGAPKPDNLPVSIWVREDLFAGYLNGNMRAFQRGERKLDELLAQKPNAPGIRSWKLSAEFFRAVLLHEANDRQAFEERYQEVTSRFEDLRQQTPNSVGLLALYGGTIATLAHRLPVELQDAANRRATEMFLRLEELQQAEFDKLPLHHRGEVLAGIAQSAARSGQDDLARKYLTRIATTLPNTPYAAFAQMMLKDKNAMRTRRIACNSCHEPNRLARHYQGEE
jgi:hypothetical protein